MVFILLAAFPAAAASANFVGDPIQVSAQFEVGEEEVDTVQHEPKATKFVVTSVRKSGKFEDILEDLLFQKKESVMVGPVMEVAAENKHYGSGVTYNQRPRPYLNVNGVIEFYTSTTKRPFKPTSRPSETAVASSNNQWSYKTTRRPFKPTVMSASSANRGAGQTN
jgi:hypothetical protein